MMDDLRDYRFYERDLIHPTGFAEDYIWEKFVETYFSENTLQLMKRWEKIMAELAHRPLKPKSENYQKFLLVLKRKLEDFPREIDCKDELELVRNRIADLQVHE